MDEQHHFSHKQATAHGAHLLAANDPRDEAELEAKRIAADLAANANKAARAHEAHERRALRDQVQRPDELTRAVTGGA